MPKNRDIFSGQLFEKEGQDPALIQKGDEVQDAAGNVYDPKTLELIKEAPSEGLLIARRQHPDWSDRELSGLARIYNIQLKKKAK